MIGSNSKSESLNRNIYSIFLPAVQIPCNLDSKFAGQHYKNWPENLTYGIPVIRGLEFKPPLYYLQSVIQSYKVPFIGGISVFKSG